MTVVGLVEDVRHYGLERPMRPGIYMPVAQLPANQLTVVIKTKQAPEAFTPTARAALRELDPELPLFRVRTMEEALARSLSQRALYLVAARRLRVTRADPRAWRDLRGDLLPGFAAHARNRHTTRARRPPDRHHPKRASGSLTIAAIGILAGLAASVGAARQLSTLLFGVPPHDTRVLVSALLVLMVTAAAANILPARRASNVDPMKSLRVE